VANSLILAGVETDTLVVYAQQEQPLSPQATGLLAQNRVVIAPLFSPRTAVLFGQAAVAAVAQILPVALSPAIAAELPEALRRVAKIAAHPDADAMLRCIVGIVEGRNWP
jgi:uroporphyrinogen-III synthase